MKIAIASDHGALELKRLVKEHLVSNNYEVLDCGTDSLESCDYPDYSYKACLAVKNKDCDLAVVMCTTGIGVSIVANKVRGIRCALVSNAFQAEMTRKHNDSNVLALGAKLNSNDESLKILDVWLNTLFEGGRHLRRVEKITEIEGYENE